jgi:hypothetical protein
VMRCTTIVRTKRSLIILSIRSQFMTIITFCGTDRGCSPFQHRNSWYCRSHCCKMHLLMRGCLARRDIIEIANISVLRDLSFRKRNFMDRCQKQSLQEVEYISRCTGLVSLLWSSVPAKNSCNQM